MAEALARQLINGSPMKKAYPDYLTAYKQVEGHYSVVATLKANAGNVGGEYFAGGRIVLIQPTAGTPLHSLARGSPFLGVAQILNRDLIAMRTQRIEQANGSWHWQVYRVDAYDGTTFTCPDDKNVKTVSVNRALPGALELKHLGRLLMANELSDAQIDGEQDAVATERRALKKKSMALVRNWIARSGGESHTWVATLPDGIDGKQATITRTGTQSARGQTAAEALRVTSVTTVASRRSRLPAITDGRIEVSLMRPTNSRKRTGELIRNQVYSVNYFAKGRISMRGARSRMGHVAMGNRDFAALAGTPVTKGELTVAVRNRSRDPIVAEAVEASLAVARKQTRRRRLWTLRMQEGNRASFIVAPGGNFGEMAADGNAKLWPNATENSERLISHINVKSLTPTFIKQTVTRSDRNRILRVTPETITARAALAFVGGNLGTLQAMVAAQARVQAALVEDEEPAVAARLRAPSGEAIMAAALAQSSAAKVAAMAELNPDTTYAPPTADICAVTVTPMTAAGSARGAGQARSVGQANARAALQGTFAALGGGGGGGMGQGAEAAGEVGV